MYLWSLRKLCRPGSASAGLALFRWDTAVVSAWPPSANKLPQPTASLARHSFNLSAHSPPPPRRRPSTNLQHPDEHTRQLLKVVANRITALFSEGFHTPQSNPQPLSREQAAALPRRSSQPCRPSSTRRTRKP